MPPRSRSTDSSDPTTAATPPESPDLPPLPPPLDPPTSPLFLPTSPPPLDTSPDPSWSPDESPSPHELGDDSPSAPRSTGGSPSRARLRGLREAIKGGIATATGIAHTLLTREGTPERDQGLYLADDDDVKAIGEPLAGLASRRLPAGAENPDVTDLIGLVVGLAGYAVKQAFKRAEIARQHAYLEGTLGDEGDQGEQPAAADV